LRVTQPLDFDQRHNIVVSAGLPFWSRIKITMALRQLLKAEKTINWLENLGVNAIISAGSGTPFSAQTNTTGDFTN
jgi:hypothetical protein